MKIKCLLASLLFTFFGNAQLLSWSPNFLQEGSVTIEITNDATKGNQGLKDYANTTDVYVHIGVITSKSTSASDWKYSKFTWATTPSNAQCVLTSTNKWKYTISGGLRSYFGITDATEKILKIAILFRNGNGSSVQRNTDASDMYIPVYDNGMYARLDIPLRTPLFNLGTETISKAVGDAVSISASASQASTLNISFNGTQVASTSASINTTANPIITSAGTQTIIAEATVGSNIVRDTITFLVAGSVTVAPLPSGVRDGINYQAGDTSVVLVLYAPSKTRVSVVGDFNNWIETLQHQMNQTPDGNRYWVRVTGLTPGVEYGFQYIIDGNLKVPDAYTEKVLDPNNDQYIPASTYPSLKVYPTGKTTGIVSIFQTAKPSYTFTTTAYTKPNKNNLVIYELLVRDFVAAQNFKTIKDSLPYLKKLGINALELMPINEFEGNNSWGYNPSFFMAPDKFYGTETSLKQLIDECHNQGIAVIMDIAMNHAFGQCPLAQMYWDATNNRPATNSPWFNPIATHPYNVGNDFNHESQATKDFVDRVIEQWLVNFKVDGFRWDLSKGFTQTNNPNDVNAWGNYDASRVAIWKRIYNKMQSLAPNSYCILEHFAANTEEIELSNYGMMLWGNLNNSFNQATMGYATDWNFQYGIFTNRGWSNPSLITYQESHDEERLQFKNATYGNNAGGYDVKTLATGFKRDEMATAFWSMIPGPKMLWQFGELGYDNTINRCEDATVNNNCRLSPKPIRWDYLQDPNRKALYTVYSKLLKLKTYTPYITTFTSSNITWDLNNGFKWMQVNEPALRVIVLGNFDVTQQTGSVTFPVAGNWYSYLTGTIKVATGNSETITLQPGEYYVYTDRNVADVVLSLPIIITPILRRDSVVGYTDNFKVRIYPNPSTQPATIECSLLQSGNLSIILTDINGKQLVNIYNGYKPKGTYNITLGNVLNLEKMATGIYLLQSNFNGRTQTIKYMVVK